MGYDDGSKDSTGKESSLGIAHTGSVCKTSKGKQQSISMWNQHLSYAAQTIAHEMGHNLGMHHDFHESHGGNGEPNQSKSKYDCDGKGLMSYDPAPNKWSSCSKSDLQAQYKAIGAADWCMPGVSCGNHMANTCADCPQGNGASWCNGDCQWVNGHCQSKGLPYIEKMCKGDLGCSKIGGTYKWKGDGQCDDKNNNEACDWDGGDCCGIYWYNWVARTEYCYLCQCLDPAKPFSHNYFW